MKIKFVLLFLFIINNVYPQNAPYLIPRHIFVGDPAVLVIPLPPASENSPDIILTPQSSNFPADINIDFHRILLERRVTGSRLLIEFSPFTPGVLELPPIEIAGEYFSGFTVNINSVIDSRSPLVLSGAASSLAMPGTAFMLYGSLTASVVIIFLTVWFILKGQTLLRKLQEKWKRLRLFNSMRKTEKRLYRAVMKGEDKRIILDRLSDEFRLFLTVLTGTNCRSMTAGEFSSVTMTHESETAFLGQYFQNCDVLRFSGAGIDSKDIFRLLDDLKNFITAQENKIKTKEEQPA